MIKKIISLSILFSIGINPSFAVENGEVDKGTSRVVSLYIGDIMLGCSGYIYEPRIVLTAGHCVTGQYPITKVGLANKTASPTAEKIDVQGVLIPETYTTQSPYQNDFAVLILSKPMTITNKVLLFNEEIQKNINGLNSQVKVAGYGEQNNQGTNFNTVRDAKYFFATLSHISNEINVINGPTGNVCSGDSGGPNTIIYNNQEVYLGATSHGWNQPNCGRYSGGGSRVLQFDPVYKYVDLIDKAKAMVTPAVIAQETTPVVKKKVLAKKKCIKLKNGKCKK
jgi:secreted trypsin-like serine protease